MKTASLRVVAAAVVTIAGMAGATSAFAQGTYAPGQGTAGTNCNPANPPNAFDSVQCGNGTAVSATMTAWGFMANTPAANSTSGNGLWQQGRIGDFNSNGFGAYTGSNESTTDSQHAFDNVTTGCGSGSGASGGTVPLNSSYSSSNGCGGSIEAVLLNFGSAKVSLSQIGIGYSSGDADMSLYMWNGTLGAAPTMTTGQAVTMNASGAGTIAGWTLIGSNDSDIVGLNPWNTGNTLYSSYFLITTYFGATSGNLDQGNDRFKINSFTAGACTGTLSGGSNGQGQACLSPAVPEPNSIALAVLALAGVGVSRHRKAAAR